MFLQLKAQKSLFLRANKSFLARVNEKQVSPRNFVQLKYFSTVHKSRVLQKSSLKFNNSSKFSLINQSKYQSNFFQPVLTSKSRLAKSFLSFQQQIMNESTQTINERKKIYLKDYLPPAFIVENISLDFNLDEERTLVKTSMQVKRNPNGEKTNKMILNGDKDCKLVKLLINGNELVNGKDFQIETLNFKNVFLNVSEAFIPPPNKLDSFSVQLVTEIQPQENKSYSGLYKSEDVFCTQCEAEGFRKITYFFDRPDVLTVYKVRVSANKSKYPVLLSNGNLVEKGDLPDGRHFTVWQDPFKKPCYLFALVAGNLSCLSDYFTTKSGTKVQLNLYAEQKDINKCNHAMASLKRAMKWDEDVFSLEYDLELFNIVAVSMFNMGAMENKSLNIFNSKYIIADNQTATDLDFENVERVVAHEYFHNWTGNRVTCRDWFQLSLKEGLTVFREQLYCENISSPSVKRIEDVTLLTTKQFEEDIGPTAHPVRPEYFYEINNFYTLTIYEKGSEVIRMIYTMLGKEKFRKGMDLYFQRHDGEAVTIDNFVSAMEGASGIDLTQFKLWYSQSGTPILDISSTYENGKLQLHIKQSCPSTPGQPSETKRPFHIPLAVGILDKNTGKTIVPTFIIHVTQAEQTFNYTIQGKAPIVLSLLRGFSAPVRLNYPYKDEELIFLAMNDSDDFCRWHALQKLYLQTIISSINKNSKNSNLLDKNHPCIQAYQKLLTSNISDKRFLAVALTLPAESEIAQHVNPWDPSAVREARDFVESSIGSALYHDFLNLYKRELNLTSPNSNSRKLKNVCLGFLLAASPSPKSESIRLCENQFKEAKNMTDEYGALVAINHAKCKERDQLLEDFFEQWKHDSLVLTKWFSLQAVSQQVSIQKLKELMNLPQFSLQSPNLVYSLLGGFSMNNPKHFHAISGEGYAFLADKIIAIDKFNPQISSRLAKAFAVYNRLDEPRQQLIKSQIQRISKAGEASSDLDEVLKSIM